MLKSAFNFNLGNQILDKKGIIIRMDGETPSLACVTIGGKVFIYNPSLQQHQSLVDQENQQIEYLNLNKNILSISAAKFVSCFPKEQLILATENHLILFDVENNSEKFYKEIQDGINCVVFGQMSGFNEGLIVVGGNCSLFGFNENGDEIYWNVTSDTVTAMCLCDMDNDEQNELVVGSEDNIIRVFKNEEIMYEITEGVYQYVLQECRSQDLPSDCKMGWQECTKRVKRYGEPNLK